MPWVSSRVAIRLAVSLAVLLLLPAWMRADPARLALLTHPSAWLAGTIISAPVALTPGDAPVLQFSGIPLRVVDGCSGADYFGLLTALLLWLSFRFRPATLILVPLTAYLMTVIANAGRLVAVLISESLWAIHLPEYLHGSVHAATGIAVFLPLLIGTYYCWERMLNHERQSI